MAESQGPWQEWRSRIEASRRRRDLLVPEWQSNVTARRGHRVETDTSGTSITINQDWPLTKAKIAQLFSQTPEVRLSPRQPDFAPMVNLFGAELNTTLTNAGVGAIVEEVLADAINASGIGAAITTCERKVAPKQVPLVDPALLPPGTQPPMTQVMATTDIAHRVERVSPADLLVPDDFTGSDYNRARWLGHDGRCTWTQAQSWFSLDESDKGELLGQDKRSSSTTNTLSTDSTKFRDTDVVNYAEIFYWRHYYHPEETSFSAIQRVVFVDGKEEPVINEPYAGQARTDQGLQGVQRLPISVLTLTYISDDAFPPSDSTISRAQVDELEASRDAMVQQRKHSIPIRWFNTNLVSSNTRSLLEQGTFQGFIGINGRGDNALGEVARANFPQERFDFDRIIKNDLNEVWQVGTNQAGQFASGERTAREAAIVQQNFQTRIGQERDKVTKFVLSIAEVVAGHLSLFGTFALPDGIGIQRQALATGFTYSVRLDSTVRLDAQQRIEQLKEALNLTAQSGFIDPKPIISEIIALSGLDPAKVMVDPKPKPPEPVNVSVSKSEDVLNPLFLAMLMRTQQGPTPQDLQAAKMLLAAAGLPTVPMAPMEPESGDPQDVQRPETAHADWEAAPRIDRRDADA